MLHNTYTTVNSSTSVFVPFSSVSHIIECSEKSVERHGETCWIQFHSGKSIHVTESFENVTADLEEYFKVLNNK
jgi:hypothetical protein